QIFSVVAVSKFLPESLIENVDGSCRGNFAGFRAADTVCNDEDAASSISEVRVFIQRTLRIQSTIADRCDVKISLGAHCTASGPNSSGARGRAGKPPRASCALRCEKAINIPSIVKLVIKLNPP